MHVCLCDIDGTLLDTGGAGTAAMKAAIRSEFGSAKTVEGIATAGRTDRAITADLFSHFGIEPIEEVWERFMNAYLRHLPEFLEDRDGSVLPGIGELLKVLNGRDDVLLGLLTGNYREGARLKLEYYRLHQHFEFGGFGDEHLDRDDVAREALEELRTRVDGEIDLTRIWVIGDTPADIRCARAIGANAVAVGTGLFPMEDREAAQPDHLLSDLTDPEPLLALLT